MSTTDHGITPHRFYVYMLLDPAGTPFYIGKGTGDRIEHHEREAKGGHLCHKCKVIRKIWQAGGQVGRAIVFTTDDERAALDYEAALIAQYGVDNLTNETIGGAGGSQRPHGAAGKRSYRINADFPARLARHGLSVYKFSLKHALSATLFSRLTTLKRHPDRRCNIQLVTAWKLARAYAAVASISEDEAFKAIIIEE